MKDESLEYVGFWARVGASLVDSLLIALVTMPILTAYYGMNYWASERLYHGPVEALVSWVFPAVAVIVFWMYKQATPGKMMLSAKILDARTGNYATNTQLIIRYLAYIVSTIPFGLGFIWVAFDDRKQGWHDKIAKTVVLRKRRQAPTSSAF